MNLFKKTSLFVSLFIIESSCLFAFANQPVLLTNTESEVLKPKVTICFTIARKRDCEGFGICNFHAIVTEGRFNNATASVSVDDFTNSLVIEIDRNKGLTPMAYERYFSSGTFLMEDDSQLPSDLSSELGIDRTVSLTQGKYPITESNGIIRFVVPFR